MLKKFKIDIPVKRSKIIFKQLRIITLNNYMLKKNGIYMLSCSECNKVYLGEAGHQVLQSFGSIRGVKITGILTHSV